MPPQLSLHEQYGSYMESTLQLATNQGVVLPPRSSAAKNVLTGMRASLSLFLPDDDVGAVLGRKGQTLVDIQQVRATGVWHRKSRTGGVGYPV